MNMKKLFLLNLPYLLFVYPFDKLVQAFRLAPGANLSGKLLSIGDGFTAALSSPCLSFHPTDLLIGMPAYAAGDPLTVVNNLSTFIFGLIRAVGLILLGWGIVQVGLSLQSHDPSQRSNGFLTLAGGIVITFAKEILDLIVG